MSFNSENGYTGLTFNQVMNEIMIGINNQFNLSYTTETFVGTNWYKYAYAITQKIVEGEVKTSEILARLQEYIDLKNQKIQRPSVSYPGILDALESQGFIASIERAAGTLNFCIQVDDTADDYADTKLAICNLIKDYMAAGIIHTSFTESELITLSNGQSFTFGYNLPTIKPALYRVTFTISDNNLLKVPDDETIRDEILTNLRAKYKLGWDFEPQRYYNLGNAPWAATVLFEYSLNGGSSWASTVYQANYKDLFTIERDDIQVVLP